MESLKRETERPMQIRFEIYNHSNLAPNKKSQKIPLAKDIITPSVQYSKSTFAIDKGNYSKKTKNYPKYEQN